MTTTSLGFFFRLEAEKKFLEKETFFLIIIFKFQPLKFQESKLIMQLLTAFANIAGDCSWKMSELVMLLGPLEA